MKSRLLYLDLGNQCLKWSDSCHPQRINEPLCYRQPGEDTKTAEKDIAVFIDEFMQRVTASTITAVIASSVNDGVLRNALSACFAAHDIPCRWLTAQDLLEQWPCEYANPQQLGIDRWLAAIAVYGDVACCNEDSEKTVNGFVKTALQSDETGHIIVDVGTATTVDGTFQGRFLGGHIFPGLNLMSAALRMDTFAINSGDATTWDGIEVFPKNTDNAVHSGILAATSGGIVSIIQLQSEALVARGAHQVVVHFTGGDGARIKQLIAAQIRALPAPIVSIEFSANLILSAIHTFGQLESSSI